ncbi:hypothetical protein [Actinoplanes sichuanensis]|uniref:hypothetical protein n=1 Tax=Actinoplanes sichuanensis TaxID=512349 RepID=UPI002954B782|nr:hypothetical protein [Actinoplanes sichuanensis]
MTEEEAVPPLDGAEVVAVGAGVAALVRRLVDDVGWVDGRTLVTVLGGGTTDADTDGPAEFDATGGAVGDVPGRASAVSTGPPAALVRASPGAAAVRRTSSPPEAVPATIDADPAPIKPSAPTTVRV